MTNSNSNINPSAVTLTDPGPQELSPNIEGHYATISGPEATLSAAIFGAIAIIIVCVLQLRHAKNTARMARLAAYEAFLLAWEQRIEKDYSPDILNAYFKEGAAQFRSEAARVRRDFKDRIEFNRLDDALSRLTTRELIGEAAFSAVKPTLSSAIKELIQFVQTAR